MSAVECAAENSDNVHIVSIFDGNCCLALNLTSKLIVNPLLQIGKNMQEIILIWLVINKAEICILYARTILQHNTLLWRWQRDTWIPEWLQVKSEVFFSTLHAIQCLRTNATRNTRMEFLFAQSLSPIKYAVVLNCVASIHYFVIQANRLCKTQMQTRKYWMSWI